MAGASQLRSEWVEYSSGGAAIRAYFSVPQGRGPWPGVVMIHENPGVTEHRMDVTRRLAAAGYATITPDLFSRVGGKPPSGASDVERRQKIDIALPDDQVFNDLMNGYGYLKVAPRRSPTASRFTVSAWVGVKVSTRFAAPTCFAASSISTGRSSSRRKLHRTARSVPICLWRRRSLVQCSTTSAIKTLCARRAMSRNCELYFNAIISKPSSSSIRPPSMPSTTIRHGVMRRRARSLPGAGRSNFLTRTLRLEPVFP